MRQNTVNSPREREDFNSADSENGLTVFGAANPRYKMSCEVFEESAAADDDDQSLVGSLSHEKCAHHHFHHHHHHYHFHSLSGSSSAGDSPFPSLGNNIILFSLLLLRAKSEANSMNFLDLSTNLQTCLLAF